MNEILMITISGAGFALIAMLVIIASFFLIGKLTRRQVVKELNRANEPEETEAKPMDADAEKMAAISLALHLYLNDVHDRESNIITIKRIQKRYSPWNSKIYGMNNFQ